MIKSSLMAKVKRYALKERNISVAMLAKYETLKWCWSLGEGVYLGRDPNIQWPLGTGKLLSQAAAKVAKKRGRVSNLINLTTMPHKGKQMQLTFSNQSCHQFVQFGHCCRCYCYNVRRGAFSICFRALRRALVNKIRRKMRTSDAYQKSSGQKVKRKCYFVAPNQTLPHPPSHLVNVDRRVLKSTLLVRPKYVQIAQCLFAIRLRAGNASFRLSKWIPCERLYWDVFNKYPVRTTKRTLAYWNWNCSEPAHNSHKCTKFSLGRKRKTGNKCETHLLIRQWSECISPNALAPAQLVGNTPTPYPHPTPYPYPHSHPHHRP